MHRIRFIHLILIALSTITFGFVLQNGDIVDPMQKYGPFQAKIYTAFEEAVKAKEEVYKLDFEGPVEYKKLEKINDLASLQVLRMKNNGFDSLPVEFGQLYNLVYFHSIGNNLSQLPENIGNLINLTELKLYYSNIDSLPAGFANFSRLKVLEIQSNAADTFHVNDVLGQLPNLEEITLYKCNLDTFPFQLSENLNLKDLNLIDCNISNLPLIGNFDMVESIILNDNKITKLPSQVYKLRKLRFLSLKGNQITSISEDIANLQKLEILDLRGNKVDPVELDIVKALLPRSCKVLN